MRAETQYPDSAVVTPSLAGGTLSPFSLHFDDLAQGITGCTSRGVHCFSFFWVQAAISRCRSAWWQGNEQGGERKSQRWERRSSLRSSSPLAFSTEENHAEKETQRGERRPRTHSPQRLDGGAWNEIGDIGFLSRQERQQEPCAQKLLDRGTPREAASKSHGAFQSVA